MKIGFSDSSPRAFPWKMTIRAPRTLVLLFGMFGFQLEEEKQESDTNWADCVRNKRGNWGGKTDVKWARFGRREGLLLLGDGLEMGGTRLQGEEAVFLFWEWPKGMEAFRNKEWEKDSGRFRVQDSGFRSLRLPDKEDFWEDSEEPPREILKSEVASEGQLDEESFWRDSGGFGVQESGFRSVFRRPIRWRRLLTGRILEAL